MNIANRTLAVIGAHKAVAAVSAAVLLTGSGLVLVAVSGGIGTPTNVRLENLSNGSATVRWDPPALTAAVTGYTVTLSPTNNNRFPMPNLGPNSGQVSVQVGPTTHLWKFSGLIEDCHQRYKVEVSAHTAIGSSGSAATPSFRPSGIITPGKTQPFVVILLDGITSHQPAFTMNPYHPVTPSGRTTSMLGHNTSVDVDVDGSGYCPESWYDSSTLGLSVGYEANFALPPNGPWSFFHKWYVGEIDDNGNPTGKNLDGTSPNTESLPRQFPSGTLSHSYLLDAIAATGAIVLPFSYKGSTLKPGVGGADPSFDFPAYTGCDSTPQPATNFGPEAPVCVGDSNANLESWANLLHAEIQSVQAVWSTTRIVVVGHSQGGLVAFTDWRHSPTSIFKGFSLDAPINGACGTYPFSPPNVCVGPVTYPAFMLRKVNNPDYLVTEKALHNPFSTIGTFGDSPAPKVLGVGSGLGGYGSGAETLEHQMLFPYSSDWTYDRVESACGDPYNNLKSCPAVQPGVSATGTPPDYISPCPVDVPLPWVTAADGGHFVVKFCPGVVAYFNQTWQSGGATNLPPTPVTVSARPCHINVPGIVDIGGPLPQSSVRIPTDLNTYPLASLQTPATYQLGPGQSIPSGLAIFETTPNTGTATPALNQSTQFVVGPSAFICVESYSFVDKGLTVVLVDPADRATFIRDTFNPESLPATPDGNTQFEDPSFSCPYITEVQSLDQVLTAPGGLWSFHPPICEAPPQGTTITPIPTGIAGSYLAVVQEPRNLNSGDSLNFAVNAFPLGPTRPVAAIVAAHIATDGHSVQSQEADCRADPSSQIDCAASLMFFLGQSSVGKTMSADSLAAARQKITSLLQ